MLTLYRILAWLLAPLVLRRIHASTDARQLARRPERRGFVTTSAPGAIWVHAASVGEINAAQGLIEALLKRPESPSVLLSTFTLTGAERARELFADRVIHCLAPLDTRASVRRWLDRHRPSIALIAETEIWPELYHQAGARDLPIVLINARLTERSLNRSRRFGRLFKRAMNSVSMALCQSREDAERLHKLGLPDGRSQITGNLKFDTTLPADIGPRARELRLQWGDRPCWVAGSTRPGEEMMMLDAQRQLLENYPKALLVLAPRHPERADEVAEMIDDAGLQWQGIGEQIRGETSVVLVNRIGVLMPCYAAAAVAFVGGSLVNIGGHNLLEPAAIGKAVLAGPHLHQQGEAARALGQAGAMITVTDAVQLGGAVGELWQNPERALDLGRKAMDVVESGRGSLRRTLRLLENHLPAVRADADPQGLQRSS
jgi:3-deoxy-D-manno-octulosonic-acid transferase